MAHLYHDGIVAQIIIRKWRAWNELKICLIPVSSPWKIVVVGYQIGNLNVERGNCRVSCVVVEPVERGVLREAAFMETIMLEDVLVVDEYDIFVAQPGVDFSLSFACGACFGVTGVESEENDLSCGSVPVTIDVDWIVNTLQPVHYALEFWYLLFGYIEEPLVVIGFKPEVFWCARSAGNRYLVIFSWVPEFVMC